MKWIELSFLTGREAVEAIANIFHEQDTDGVVIDDPLELAKERIDQFGEIYALNAADYPDEGVLVKGYFAACDFSDELRQKIEKAVTGLRAFHLDIGRNLSNVREVDEEDWATAWKEYYHPVRVTETITIVPSWEDYKVASADEKVIHLDPGMAFGTGTHPTTTLCIQALEKHIKPTVIDVGTGSGVLAIAAALLGATSVKAIDLDAVAVEVAIENCQINQVEDIVSVSKGDLLSGIIDPVDLVVANILADVIIKIADDVYHKLKDNGIFIASGIITEKKEQVIAAVIDSGFEVVEVAEESGWVAITAIRIK